MKPTEGAAAPTVKAPAAKKKAISVKPLEAKPATDKVRVQQGCMQGLLLERVHPADVAVVSPYSLTAVLSPAWLHCLRCTGVCRSCSRR